VIEIKVSIHRPSNKTPDSKDSAPTDTHRSFSGHFLHLFALSYKVHKRYLGGVLDATMNKLQKAQSIAARKQTVAAMPNHFFINFTGFQYADASYIRHAE